MMTRPNSERHYAKMLEACLQDFEIRGVGMAFVFFAERRLEKAVRLLSVNPLTGRVKTAS
jgi:hypothetical protein